MNPKTENKNFIFLKIGFKKKHGHDRYPYQYVTEKELDGGYPFQKKRRNNDLEEVVLRTTF